MTLTAQPGQHARYVRAHLRECTHRAGCEAAVCATGHFATTAVRGYAVRRAYAADAWRREVVRAALVSLSRGVRGVG